MSDNLETPDRPPLPKKGILSDSQWELAWTVYAFVGLLLIQILSYGIAQTVYDFFVGKRAGRQPELSLHELPPPVVIATSGLSQLLSLAMVVLLLKYVNRIPISERLRWRGDNGVKTAVVVAAAFAIAIFNITFEVAIPPDNIAEVPIGRLLESWTALTLMAPIAILIAPFCEEIFFRGYFFGPFEKSLGGVAAIVISATVFTSVHASQLDGYYIGLAPIFLMGFSAGLIRSRSGGLRAPVIFHLTYNSVLYAFEIANRLRSGDLP